MLSNNLFMSFGAADDENREDMFEIVLHIYSNLPSGCYGSVEKVDKWIAAGGIEGMTRNEEMVNG